MMGSKQNPEQSKSSLQCPQSLSKNLNNVQQLVNNAYNQHFIWGAPPNHPPLLTIAELLTM